jgi:two-component system sensor histidine kinase KdpD
MASFRRREPLKVVLALAAVIAITAGFRLALQLTNPTTAALAFLLVILITAATSKFWVALLTSVVADLCLNYFFMSPFGTFTIADPQNWTALFVFLAVALIGSQLSAAVRDREREAGVRRDELGRLFDLSRDVLLTTDSRDAIRQLARFVSRRFDLDLAALCLPRGQQWDIYEAGARSVTLDPHELMQAFAGAESALEFDARARTYAGHRTTRIDGADVRLVPLRIGTKAIGLLAAAGRPVEPGTLDALAGVVAIAVERAQFLEERKAAEVARRSEELKSALLASLSHDLRTPLTAIRVAASNLKAAWIRESDREEQSDLILAEVERLNRMFQNILEMARIEAGSIAADVRWVHPAEIVEAARDQVEHTLKHRRVIVDDRSDRLVRLDPRLTASALAHLLENAAQYTHAESPIDVNISVSADGLTIAVRDYGPGISPRDLNRVFDRFYRGAQTGQRVSGTGMGLSIARGMLTAEGGRVWAENCPAGGGAQFTIVVPSESKSATTTEHV